MGKNHYVQSFPKNGLFLSQLSAGIESSACERIVHFVGMVRHGGEQKAGSSELPAVRSGNCLSEDKDLIVHLPSPVFAYKTRRFLTDFFKMCVFLIFAYTRMLAGYIFHLFSLGQVKCKTLFTPKPNHSSYFFNQMSIEESSLYDPCIDY